MIILDLVILQKKSCLQPKGMAQIIMLIAFATYKIMLMKKKNMFIFIIFTLVLLLFSYKLSFGELCHLFSYSTKQTVQVRSVTTVCNVYERILRAGLSGFQKEDHNNP